VRCEVKDRFINWNVIEKSGFDLHSTLSTGLWRIQNHEIKTFQDVERKADNNWAPLWIKSDKLFNRIENQQSRESLRLSVRKNCETMTGLRIVQIANDNLKWTISSPRNWVIPQSTWDGFEGKIG
jgi:hypothetical protein